MTYSESIKKELNDEKSRIISSIIPKEHKGIIVDYITHCSSGCAKYIHKKAREILLLINDRSYSTWPDINEWISILPEEYVESFRNSNEDEDWILSDWLYWFEIENRAWFLWNINVIDENHLKISVLIYEHPFPSESLKVMFTHLGTDELIETNIY